MERRVILATVLSFAFMLIYAQTFGRSSTPPARQIEVESSAASPSGLSPKIETSFFAPKEEEVLLLKSKEKHYLIGRESAAIKEVVLNEFQHESGLGPVVFKEQAAVFHPFVGIGPTEWAIEEESSRRVRFLGEDAEGRTFDLVYAIKDSGVLEMSVRPLSSRAPYPIKIAGAMQSTSEKIGHYARLEVNARTLQTLSDKNKYKRYYAPVKESSNVPRGTIQLTLADNYFCQSFDFKTVLADVAVRPTDKMHLRAEARLLIHPEDAGQSTYRMELYFGPRDYFYLKRAGAEMAFKIGILGQIGLMLLALLSWIANITHNYGAAIIVFAVLVSVVQAPFTLMQHRSMVKMQKVQPIIAKIQEKHKGDPQRLQTEMMAVYREHQINPLAGCVPLLIQLPILIALFQAISHFIELRGESFLWIRDLSMPDRLATLPFAIPFMGDAVNALPVAMALVMFVQTRMSQAGAQQNNPMAKMMSGPIFPILFTVLFYNFPSGLVLYYFINSLISVSMSRLVKRN